jgi:hypothetical protein
MADSKEIQHRCLSCGKMLKYYQVDEKKYGCSGTDLHRTTCDQCNIAYYFGGTLLVAETSADGKARAVEQIREANAERVEIGAFYCGQDIVTKRLVKT